MKEISQLKTFIKYADILEKYYDYDTIEKVIDHFNNADILLVDGSL